MLNGFLFIENFEVLFEISWLFCVFSYHNISYQSLVKQNFSVYNTRHKKYVFIFQRNCVLNIIITFLQEWKFLKEGTGNC